VVERTWDGQVWTGEVAPAPEGTDLPHYKKHFFGFLHRGGWKLLLAYVILVVAATALWRDDRKADWVHGIQILAVPMAFLATLIVMLAFLRFVGRRVGFDRIPSTTRREIFKWGVLAGVIGFILAFAIEVLIPMIFGDRIKDDPGWSVLAGPAEETGKLLIPVLLWIKGRFRLPREGYLLVLVSAMTFGVIEGTEYMKQPETWQPSRPFFEIMHPLLTGFVAAIAWQAAWHLESIFTRAAIGAWVIAMIAHSTNDLIVLSKHVDGSVARLTNFITIGVVILMYVLQKHSARQLVPPDNVGQVSPRWRPAAPKVASAQP
jgi:hypothetical protein